MNEWVERAKREGTPLIDGETATFVWQGETAPYLFGDFNNWGVEGREPNTPLTMTQAEPGVWTYAMPLPRDAYMEYVFIGTPGDEDTRQLDPFNKSRVSNGIGRYNNYFAMPERPKNQRIQAGRGVTAGKVTQHQLTYPLMLGGKRDVWLYQPPVAEPVPLLVVYDGRDYLKRAKLPTIVDHLIAEGEIQPVALAMIDNARQGRMTEYNTNETLLLILLDHLLPLAHQHLNLIQGERAYGVLGASMGGLSALYTALRLPHLFPVAISQSGAFHIDFAPEAPALIKTLIEHLPPPPIRIWQDVGRYEWLLEDNRRVNQKLREKGYTVQYEEFNAGHNYSAWRDMLPAALKFAFPPQP